MQLADLVFFVAGLGASFCYQVPVATRRRGNPLTRTTQGRTAARYALGVACLATLAASSSGASAQTMHRSPHIDEETANIVGLKGGVTNVFSNGAHAVGGGFSPFYERNVIAGWLELEAALAVTWIENENVLGFDFFAKKPFHVNEAVNLYVGVGPNMSVIFGREETETRFGILATAGSYLWLSRGHRWGIDIEVVYLALFASDLTHELTLEVGPVFRF